MKDKEAYIKLKSNGRSRYAQQKNMGQEYGLERRKSFKVRLKKAFEDLNNVNAWHKIRLV